VKPPLPHEPQSYLVNSSSTRRAVCYPVRKTNAMLTDRSMHMTDCEDVRKTLQPYNDQQMYMWSSNTRRRADVVQVGKVCIALATGSGADGCAT